MQYLHWAWIFWVNIPLGILSIAGIWLFLHESVDKRGHDIDFPGAFLLFTCIGTLMIVLIQGGVAWPWSSGPIIILLAVFVLCFGLFILQERRSTEPIMPLELWKNRLIAVSNAASLTTGAVMIGVTTFLPTFVQGVMGKTPTVAGFTLTMMSIGWPIASTMAGRLMLKIGFRKTAVSGGFALLIGAIFFITLTPLNGPVWAGIGTFFIGAGMGLATTTFVVSIQSCVDWKQRGAATASNMFMRIMGNTIGAAMLGGVLNSYMTAYLKTRAGKNPTLSKLDAANVLLDPKKLSAIPDSIKELLRNGLTASLHSVYWVVFFLTVLSLVLIFTLPKDECEVPETVSRT